MRWSARRLLIGAAAVLAGIVGINQSMMDAADPVPDADLKILFDQDAKNIPPMIELGNKKGSKANASKASRAITSNAMAIAWYANSRILGKKPDDDAKMAMLRDTAIKVAVAAHKKKFTAASEPARLLDLNMKPGAAVKPKAMTIAELFAACDMDMEELMYQLKKKDVGGLGVEEEIKALAAKKGTITPEKASAMAVRLRAIAEFCQVMEPQKKFTTKTPKKDWDTYNADMVTALKDIVDAAKSKDAKKKVPDAFLKLDGACTACHEKFKG
jgi:hypothetical protein